jgi:hypothetical protein
MRFNQVSLVMDGTYNDAVISSYLILMNNCKTWETKSVKDTCQSHVCATVSIGNLRFSAGLEDGGTMSINSIVTTMGAV